MFIAMVVRLWFEADFNKLKFPFYMKLVIQDNPNLVLLFFVHYFNMFNASYF